MGSMDLYLDQFVIKAIIGGYLGELTRNALSPSSLQRRCRGGSILTDMIPIMVSCHNDFCEWR